MQGSYKYRPNKTQLTLAEHKELIAKYSKDLKKAIASLSEAEAALKWTRDKLIEVEDENRRLKLIILRMTEEREKKDGS